MRAALDRRRGALLPHRAGDYPNFVEEPADASAFFDAGDWARLRDGQGPLRPGDDLFAGNHHIPAGGVMGRVASLFRVGQQRPD